MNWEKLFKAQKELDKHILQEKGLEGQDLLDMKILALQVEVGELANEQRTWKFWSKDQKPRTEDWIECSDCDGTGDLNYDAVQEDAEGSGRHEYIDCKKCDCAGTIGVRNPLLVEYVDCFHFILSIGNDLNIKPNLQISTKVKEVDSITESFLYLNKCVSFLYMNAKYEYRNNALNLWNRIYIQFMQLGEMLGFTEQQIEQAYWDKNSINHKRQESNY